MKRYSYGERDDAFGQAMLTLRTALGLTQAGLAQRFGVSGRAVRQWEAGLSYPTAEHLKEFLTLCVRQQAFPPGREEEEIRALWKAAHQKVLLDEAWLAALLKQPSPPPTPLPVEESGGALVGSAPTPAPTDSAPALQPGQPPPSLEPVASRAPAGSGPRVDWGDALDVPSFYGRQGELATLAQWVVWEHCRVVSVLGMGGIGKSALVTSAMRQLASHFQVVLFRSLRDAPSCESLLESCLQVLSPASLVRESQGLSARLRLLSEQLRSRRVLLVLDNLESLLQAGEVRGRLRPGFEAYGHLLRQVAQSGHHSCLLLTSREKPTALPGLEGRKTPVRALRLDGLEASACEQLLVSHELIGSPQERARLIERYGGNPLALNIVAQTIADLFGGEIRPFLEADTAIFGGIAELLWEQWGRLSPLEQTLLFWLAILREPVTLEELEAVLVARLSRVQLLEAVDGLRRRSLIERGQQAGSFTLQSVVLEFVTDRLVRTVSEEIRQGRLALLLSHGLSQAEAKEYVRQTQERLLLASVLASLESVYRGRAEVEERLRTLLDEGRGRPQQAQGYRPANLVALLRLLRGHLRGLDLSHLSLRGVSLQGVEMQDANLSGALMRESVFTQSFDAITAVAISQSGQYWAAGGRRGEVRVWRENGQRLHLVWQAHTDIVMPLAFNPDEHLLASGSLDGSLKLWNIESGALLWSGWHTKGTTCLAFSPDGGLLASGGHDGTARLWEASLGTPLEDLPHPASIVSLAWSRDGRLLASGDVVGTIRLWERQQNGSARGAEKLSGHSSWVRGLAFAPDGGVLASSSYDGSVKLWEVGEEGSLRMRRTLVGHTQRVQALAWSPNGGTVASGGGDHTIRLWDVEQGTSRLALQGHTAEVYSLAFTPDSGLLSGSEDGTLRLWEVEQGQCVRVLEGYDACLYDVDWSPDGTEIASAGSESVVSLWQVADRAEGRPRGVLRGHEWVVHGVAWQPDGSVLASAGLDHAIRLWDPATGSCLQVIRDLDHPDTLFWGVAWSPDGKLLAGATFSRGVLLWEMTAASGRWIGRELPIWFRRLAWSPDGPSSSPYYLSPRQGGGSRLVAGGNDGHVYVWDASDGRLLQRLAGHQGAVMSVAFSPDGSRLASGGSGELLVWDGHSGQRVHAFVGHPGVVSALSWVPSGELLVSGGSDGMLRWWNLQHGECVWVREAHQGTVQALKVSPDGSMLASCGDDGAIKFWDLESGEHLHTLRRDRPYERLNITGIRGLTQAEIATLRALGAVEDEASNSSEHAAQR